MRKRMRRSTKIKLGCMATLLVITCTSVSVKAWPNNNFNKAIINTFDGSMTVDVKTWDDFKDGINIQIVTTDGKVYYTSAENIILIHEK